MLAATGDPPCGRTVAAPEVSVDTFIAREKVAVGEMATATPVALSAGVVAVTVGASAVVKLQLTAEASAAPLLEVAAVEIWAV